ncbi:MAG: hypothetical protein JRN16_05685, partial [Nitrososphaerota archaeon]|nr:hypothetical protein [Nitrososphaerota archaeon]
STTLSKSSPSAGGSGVPEFPYQFAGAVILAALVSLAYLGARKFLRAPSGPRTFNRNEAHPGL